MKLSHLFTGFMTIVVVFLSACATDEFGNPRAYTDTEKGAMFGAAGGAIVGALAAKDAPAKGALIGMVGGGLAGGAVGHYMDGQKKDLEKVLTEEKNSGAIQLAKQSNDVIIIRMTSQTAFASGSSVIQPGYHSTLDKIATVVNRYGKTFITVVGHTDSVGIAGNNQALSESRANAVERYLSQKSVVPQRLTSRGMGENSPVADNATEQGRLLNRRVELIIEPIVDKSK
jgi:outer membrane protein OmpA-like peptidoglycan-associated protein